MSLTQIQKLEQEIDSRKKRISELRTRRIQEIAKLASKAGLQNIPDDYLLEEFQMIALKHKEKLKEDDNAKATS